MRCGIAAEQASASTDAHEKTGVRGRWCVITQDVSRSRSHLRSACDGLRENNDPFKEFEDVREARVRVPERRRGSARTKVLSSELWTRHSGLGVRGGRRSYGVNRSHSIGVKVFLMTVSNSSL